MAPATSKYFIGRPALAATTTTMTRPRPYSRSAKGASTGRPDCMSMTPPKTSPMLMNPRANPAKWIARPVIPCLPAVSAEMLLDCSPILSSLLSSYHDSKQKRGNGLANATFLRRTNAAYLVRAILQIHRVRPRAQTSSDGQRSRMTDLQRCRAHCHFQRRLSPSAPSGCQCLTQIMCIQGIPALLPDVHQAQSHSLPVPAQFVPLLQTIPLHFH